MRSSLWATAQSVKRLDMTMEGTQTVDSGLWKEGEGWNIATLRFESESKADEVEKALRIVCPKDTVVAGSWSSGCVVGVEAGWRAYVVILVLSLTVDGVREHLTVEEPLKKEGEEERSSGFQEFCRQYVRNVRVGVVERGVTPRCRLLWDATNEIMTPPIPGEARMPFGELDVVLQGFRMAGRVVINKQGKPD